jgi:hypothetical protein
MTVNRQRSPSSAPQFRRSLLALPQSLTEKELSDFSRMWVRRICSRFEGVHDGLDRNQPSANVRNSSRYASDLTDRGWGLIAPFMPEKRRLGRPRTTSLQEVAVEGFVCKQAAEIDAVDQWFHPNPILAIAGQQLKANQIAKRIGEGLDFCCPTAPGLAYSLALSPPFRLGHDGEP